MQNRAKELKKAISQLTNGKTADCNKQLKYLKNITDRCTIKVLDKRIKLRIE